jgi:cytidylate kinase
MLGLLSRETVSGVIVLEAALILSLGVFAHQSLTAYALQPDLPTYGPLRLALGGVAVLGIFLVAGLFATGWSGNVPGAVGGLGFSLAAMLLVGELSAVWGVSFARRANANELWWESTSPRELDLLVKTVEEISVRETGTPDEMPFVVQGDRDSALGWALRPFEYVEFVDQPARTSAPALFIAPLLGEPGARPCQRSRPTTSGGGLLCERREWTLAPSLSGGGWPHGAVVRECNCVGARGRAVPPASPSARAGSFAGAVARWPAAWSGSPNAPAGKAATLAHDHRHRWHIGSGKTTSRGWPRAWNTFNRVMYRALTLAALRQGVPSSDEHGLASLAQKVTIDVTSPTVADGRPCTVLLDGEDVSWGIRSPEVDANVSPVSIHAGVRSALTDKQRRIGLRGGVVMAGRDIGTAASWADLKCSRKPRSEARRRMAELTLLGEAVEFGDVMRSLAERDRIDSERRVAPLRAAPDALIVDTTHLSADEVFELVMGHIQKHEPGAPAGAAHAQDPTRSTDETAG